MAIVYYSQVGVVQNGCNQRSGLAAARANLELGCRKLA